MVACDVKWEWGRESPESNFLETPKQNVGFQIKRRSFTLGFRPASREPTDVFASGVIVGNDKGREVRERDSGGGWSVGSNGEGGAGGEIVELVQSKCLAVIGGISSAVER